MAFFLLKLSLIWKTFDCYNFLWFFVREPFFLTSQLRAACRRADVVCVQQSFNILTLFEWKLQRKVLEFLINERLDSENRCWSIFCLMQTLSRPSQPSSRCEGFAFVVFAAPQKCRKSWWHHPATNFHWFVRVGVASVFFICLEWWCVYCRGGWWELAAQPKPRPHGARHCGRGRVERLRSVTLWPFHGRSESTNGSAPSCSTAGWWQKHQNWLWLARGAWHQQDLLSAFVLLCCLWNRPITGQSDNLLPPPGLMGNDVSFLFCFFILFFIFLMMSWLLIGCFFFLSFIYSFASWPEYFNPAYIFDLCFVMSLCHHRYY